MTQKLVQFMHLRENGPRHAETLVEPFKTWSHFLIISM